MNSQNQKQLNLNLPTDQDTQPSTQSETMMLAMAEMGMDKQVLAGMLTLWEVSQEHINWLSAPIIVQKSPWAETIPGWLITAICKERLEHIFTETREDKVGKLATPAEVMACIYPATMDAPVYRSWADVYLWCGSQVFPKHNRLADEESFWAAMGDQPVEFSTIEQYYNEIAWDIRKKAIAESKRRNKDSKTKTEQENSAIVQLSLF